MRLPWLQQAGIELAAEAWPALPLCPQHWSHTCSHLPSPWPAPACPARSIFNDHELELLISGLPEIDVDDLRAQTEYSGGWVGGWVGGRAGAGWCWWATKLVSCPPESVALQSAGCWGSKPGSGSPGWACPCLLCSCRRPLLSACLRPAHALTRPPSPCTLPPCPHPPAGYTAASTVVQWFWEVVREMDKQDLALLMQFVTGGGVGGWGWAGWVGLGGLELLVAAHAVCDHLLLLMWLPERCAACRRLPTTLPPAAPPRPHPFFPCVPCLRLQGPARCRWMASRRCRGCTGPRSSRSTRPTAPQTACPQVGALAWLGGVVGARGGAAAGGRRAAAGRNV